MKNAKKYVKPTLYTSTERGLVPLAAAAALAGGVVVGAAAGGVVKAVRNDFSDTAGYRLQPIIEGV